MDQNLNKKIDRKEKLISIFKENKLKIYSSFTIIILLFAALFLFKKNQDDQRKLISEKYIQAGIQLSIDKKENAKKIFEEIIVAENSFYSALALNSIVDKNLIKDKEKILEYFNLVEKITKSEEKKDLLIFKKALFLIQNENLNKGNKLLKELIERNSKLKSLAEVFIVN